MNGNKRMSPFVSFPEHELDFESEQPRGLVPMGQVMDGEVDPFSRPAPAPAPAMTPQQQYSQGQPTGKKILGMPKDQFIALMGSIAHAFGGDSPSGRMGANLINMAGMLREERMGQAKAQAAEAKAKREAQKPKEKKYAGDVKAFHDIYGRPPSSAKELREFKTATALEKKEKPPGQWEEFRAARKDKPIGEVIKEYKAIGGKESKEMSHAEERARRKESRGLEASILDPANLENPALQVNIKAFNKLPDTSYMYHRTQGTPAKETGWFDLEMDVKAVPSTIEKVDISGLTTKEKVRDSDLPVALKLELLRNRFGMD